MKILIAEDEPDIATTYRIALERRNHSLVMADNGDDCLKAYHDALKQMPNPNGSPFDAVVLDYRMPKKDGLKVAKEILAVNSHQRIIFASAYVRETLVDSVKELKQVVELLQKPFTLDAFVETLEDKEIYPELEKFNVQMSFSSFNLYNHTPEDMGNMLEHLRVIQKCRTF